MSTQPINNNNGEITKRPPRACTIRKRKSSSPPLVRQPQIKIIPPARPPSQLERKRLRDMWELASVLNFFKVFRSLLKINVEFSAVELETALIRPNNTLRDIHIPLLKAIAPNTRPAIGHETWISVLCRKLKDWWCWVGEGKVPIVASRGSEIVAYNALDPAVRVLILKALCDIRLEQEDMRNYIDDMIKTGLPLSTFRKECVGGDSRGISYWYEEDSVIGHRLYRERRELEMKKIVGPVADYQWETLATNFDEFRDIAERLCLSESRAEIALGKKLKTEMLPEIEKVHKKKEKLLKKQHREALLLYNSINMDRLGPERSRRERKHVNYSFDDYEGTINEAMEITKQNQLAPEPNLGEEIPEKRSTSLIIRWTRSAQAPPLASLDTRSPKSFDSDDISMDQKPELLGNSNPQGEESHIYQEEEFVKSAPLYEYDDDDEYSMGKRPKRKLSSSYEADEAHHMDKEYPKCDGTTEEDGIVNSSSRNEDGDEHRRFNNSEEDNLRKNKSRSVDKPQLCHRQGDKPTLIRISFKKV